MAIPRWASGRWFLGSALLLAGSLGVSPTPSAAAELPILEQLRQSQSKSRWAESDSLAQACLGQLEGTTPVDSLAVAYCSLALAQARWKTNSYSDGTALAAARRALGIRQRQLGIDHLEVADAHTILGAVLAGVDQADSARVQVQRAIRLREQKLAADDPLLAESWSQLGDIERDRRSAQAALAAFQRAVDILRQRYPEGHRDLAGALAELGDCWSSLDDVDRARESLGQSIAMFRNTLGPDHYAMHHPLNYLATAETQVGNLARAAELQQESLRIQRLTLADDDVRVAVIRANLASGLMRLGDYAGARTIFRQLLPIFTASYGETNVRTLSLRGSLGIACGGSGDYDEALVHLRAVEAALAARQGPPPGMLGVALRFQGEVLHLKDEHAAARQVCERGIAVERQANRPFSESLIAMHYLLLSTLESLREYATLDSVRLEVNRLAEEYKIAGTGRYPTLLYWNARVDRDLGDLDAAWPTILQADQLARERVRDNVRALPDRRALEFARQQSRYLDLLLDLSGRLEAARWEIAWDRLVQMRGLVRDEVSSRRLSWQLRDDAELVRVHAAWRTSQQQLAQRMVDVGNVETDSLLVALRGAAEEAERSYVRSLGERQMAHPGNVSLAAVRAQLPPRAALVSVAEIYVASDTTSMLAFVTRSDATDIVRLELGRSAELRAEIEAWQALLSQSPLRGGREAEAECRRLGRRVRTLTWDRLAPAIGDAEDVYLVADGPLLELPWQALPDQGQRYWIEVGPRLHLLQAERELLSPVEAGSNALLAVGAPDFDLDTSTLPTAPADSTDATVIALRSNPSPCADLRNLELVPLPATESEAREVAAAWKRRQGGATTVLLLGADAGEAAFKRLAPGQEVLHIATHGVVAADSCAVAEADTRGVGGLSVLPTQSASTPPATNAKPANPPTESVWADRNVWVALAGANRASELAGDENDGLLTAEEVVTLNLVGTRWVVLSACHSAAGASWSREGTLGMRRAFHLAGARTVVASQWAVEDKSAGEWMQALYASHTRSAAEALRSATRTVLERRRRDGDSTHPFYWAAFSASGE